MDLPATGHESAQAQRLAGGHGPVQVRARQASGVVDPARQFREADAPRHETYNSGGTPISLAELAALVREFLPDAEINFEAETGGRESSGNFMIDNSRLIEEFGVQYAPLRQRVKEVINAIREDEGLELVS